ncbi:Y-family DNA polymerase [Aidingimonas halophila]|uniref:DNA polymerase V n=1 Tax=Aidingimonas halophila TaxID=574349 RepID=A0A1H3EMD2_9GAMM|nr:Y-family DNA polymerase [Aidingimonas halophila]GHC31405.1 umuC protein [Aidingimonas halophila]SDX79926.1 DNA polymerase V [Aidingimonas halophila]
MFALVDCNNFYVACERLFRPDLAGRAVAVLSNNDGCVIARSQECKNLGVPMGIPTHKIAPSQRRHLHLCSSNYALYGDLSSRVQQVLGARVPALDPYSIDECFLDLSGLAVDELESLGNSLVRAVDREVGLPVSVGIAPTRTLAKLANQRAKRQPQTPQVCVWTHPDDPTLTTWLSSLPLSAIWGIGNRLQAALTGQNILTADTLRDAPQPWLKQRFSVVVARIARELSGAPCLSPHELETPRRHILCSRSFGRSLTDPRDLAAALRHHCQQAGEKLRRDGMQAGAVGVFLRTNPFQTTPQHRSSLWAALPCPSADTRHINQQAQQLLAHVWREGHAYQKVGIMLTDLSSRHFQQRPLFARQDSPQQERLMNVWDGIRQRFGHDALTLGIQAADARWRMQSRRRSPRYTTRWDELPRVSSR